MINTTGVKRRQTRPRLGRIPGLLLWFACAGAAGQDISQTSELAASELGFTASRANQIMARQEGTRNSADIEQMGHAHQAQLTQSGQENLMWLTQSGTHNTAVSHQSGYANTAAI